MELYAIVDKVAKTTIGDCFVRKNDGVALRGFIDFLKNEKIKADEFVLIHIAEVDELFNLVSTKRYIVTDGKDAEKTYEELKTTLEVE